MEQTIQTSLAPTEKKKINKANILMASLMLLMLAAAITFAVLWLTKKAPAQTTVSSTENCKVENCPPCTESESGSNNSPNFMYFSQEKITNGESDQVYGAYYSGDIPGPDGQSALRVTVSAAGSNRATIMADWQTLEAIYIARQTPPATDGHSYQTYELDFSQAIADVFIAGAGQMLGSERILFLMADGSVEYIPVQEAIAAKEFKSYGKLEGLNNIVKFYRGTVAQTDSPVGGGAMSYAQDASGNIYLLYP